jgi:hypothetical protein
MALVQLGVNGQSHSAQEITTQNKLKGGFSKKKMKQVKVSMANGHHIIAVTRERCKLFSEEDEFLIITIWML